MTYNSKNITRSGFTIVELLVVIVVIGILAAVITVAYNGVTKNASVALVKDSVKKAHSLLMAASIETETYGSTFPSTVKVSNDIGLALTTVSDPKTFCINATHIKYNDVAWHSSPQDGVKEGLCTGSVITGSIVGTYNTNAGGGSGPVTANTSVGTAIGDGGGFKVVTNDNWKNITLSWNAVSGASKYEIQTRTSSSDTWMIRRTSDGSDGWAVSNASDPGYAAASGQIPSSTTSLTWTGSIPTASGQTYEYRLRPYNGSTPSGTWFTALLSATSNDNLAAVTSFTATPNTNWNSLVLAWSANTVSVPGAAYEINTRPDSSEPWMIRRSSDGVDGWAVSNAGVAGYEATTGQLPTTTTSLTWNGGGGIPRTSGQSYEFRIRIRSSTLAGVFGPWTNITLTPPANNTLPSVNTFTVTPNAGYTNITLAWSGNISSIPQGKYEIQSREGASSSWMIRRISDGTDGWSPQFSVTPGYEGISGQIPQSTTLLTWTGNIPPVGQTYDYRIRGISYNIANVYGPWTTVSIAR